MAIASSTSSYGIVPTTGPKIYSRANVIALSTPAKIVGVK